MCSRMAGGKRKRTAAATLKHNPFELRVNKRKHDILGQKFEKNERGIPGVSRSRAIQKRRNTLLKEYKNRYKTNDVVDHRFAENNERISFEEKMIMRQIRQAKKRHVKSSIYNLEEEQLTHCGQSLGDIEKFDDLVLSSDNDEVDNTEDHFGGFLKRKQQLLSDDISDQKTRKQTINEIVAKSKQHKFERQQERNKIEDLLNVIDNQWKDIIIQTPSILKSIPKTTSINTTTDVYDRYLKELEKEPRAVAGEKMLNSKEQEMIEKRKLEQFKQDEFSRMQIDITATNATSSGDHDGHVKKKEDRRIMLQYTNDAVSNIALTEDKSVIQDNELEDNNGAKSCTKNELDLLLSEQTPSDVIVTVNNMMINISVKNMKILFSSIVDYCLLLADQPLTDCIIEVMNNLAKPLYKCCQCDPAHSAMYIKSILKGIFKRYKQQLKKKHNSFPLDRDIVLFTIVGILFPMSDYYHPVTTPTLHLMTLSISQSHVVNIKDIIQCSYICQLLIESISKSKRYIPELINYLNGILSIFIPHYDSSTLLLPFTNYKLDYNVQSIHQPLLNLLQMMCIDDISDEHIICVSLINSSCKQIHQLSCLWQLLTSYDAIFKPVHNVLICLKEVITDTDCHQLMESVTLAMNTIQCSLNAPKPVLQLLKQKPKSLTFFEPSIDMEYQPCNKRRHPHKAIAEKFKLRHKHKREMKGAVREIRKDNKFLARERIMEQLKSDAVRNKKVKQIFGWLQQEHSEGKRKRK